MGGKAAAEAASTPEAAEAARVKALTPAQREAESNARKDVMWARCVENDKRSTSGKKSGGDVERI